MPDQADGLRRLIRSREGPGVALAEPPPEARLDDGERTPAVARSLVITSGKGGVGTSNLALNLAIALGQYGRRVVLVDADLGLANLDLLCGLTPACDLGDVLADGRPLLDAIVPGPADIRILAGAHGMRRLAASSADDAPARLVADLAELEADCDFLLVDAGTGLGPGIATMAAAADAAIIVTTPEPTSIADAHAAIARLRPHAGGPPVRLVVNAAGTAGEAADCLARLVATSRQFLGAAALPLGYVRSDPHVPLAVRRRRPFVAEFPRCPAARDVRRIARTLIEERRPRPLRPGFFAVMARRWALGRVAR